ncbi:hypothetical protein [Gordonia amicalis]|uniref:Uncharacterized protein n=1 Tax=Gordonia amicalis TaxID=89053 RepID=A0ABU4DJJ6_9ACTN|nr:hypothetical protein [Gordonia amicalis]MDV6309936.1 hypothetical protein [Gordonia amicalis]
MAAPKTGPTRIVTVERAQADIDEFEFFLSFGMGIEAACERLGMHPRTVYRRYAFLGRTDWPAGMAALNARRRTQQVAS